MEQTTAPIEHRVFRTGAALTGEAAFRVTREAAGEVLAHISVGHLLGAIHQNLCSIIQLRRAVHGEQQCQRLLEGKRVGTVTQKAVGIVVFDERHHA